MQCCEEEMATAIIYYAGRTQHRRGFQTIFSRKALLVLRVNLREELLVFKFILKPYQVHQYIKCQQNEVRKSHRRASCIFGILHHQTKRRGACF